MEGDGNNPDLDDVQTRAVKGAVVSGLRRPIDSNPLECRRLTGIGSSEVKLLSIGADDDGIAH